MYIIVVKSDESRHPASRKFHTTLRQGHVGRVPVIVDPVAADVNGNCMIGMSLNYVGEGAIAAPESG